jgi:hypothetical protein
MLCVLGELVDMLPVPTADADTTAPHFVARPGGPLRTRIGADPPTRGELDAARSAR